MQGNQAASASEASGEPPIFTRLIYGRQTIVYYPIGQGLHYYDWVGHARQEVDGVSRDPFWDVVCAGCHLRGHIQRFCFLRFEAGAMCSYCTHEGHPAEYCQRRLTQNESLYQAGFLRQRLSPLDVYGLAMDRPGRGFRPDPLAVPRTDYRLFVAEVGQEQAATVIGLLASDGSTADEAAAIAALRRAFHARRQVAASQRPVSALQARIRALQGQANSNEPDVVVEEIVEIQPPGDAAQQEE